MDIYARPGSKVVFSNPSRGFNDDQSLASEHLEVGKVYTVSSIEVDSWYTDVLLVEVPSVKFNSVLFEDIED